MSQLMLLEEIAMYVENYRSLVQGILILVLTAVAYWVSQPIGLGLLAFIGVMKLQESRTNWCPSDPVLKIMGVKKKKCGLARISHNASRLKAAGG